MLITELYKGQGLGNQLACYIATRVIAKDRGYDFGVMHPERFKGIDFLNLDFGKQVIGGKGPEGGPPKELPEGIKYYYREKKIIHPSNGADIRLYDKNLVNILDNTKIDGLMQDEQYIFHHRDEIRKWLKVKEKYECFDYSDDNTCIINFRGGEYTRVKDFFLDENYWKNAVSHMLKINPHFRFIVITDDVPTAKKFFPSYGVFHFSIAKDYVIIKNAKYLILSNSSFAWFPAWLNNNLKFCIAPKYWGRYNISDGYWSLGYNITSGWQYLDRSGRLTSYAICLNEFREYINSHQGIFSGMEEANKLTPKNNLKLLLKKYTPKQIKTTIIYTNNKLRGAINYFGRLIDLIKERRGEKIEKCKDNYQPKIYDIFTIFHEMDLLEMRLEILDPYVDKFVIVEATETFMGVPKKLFYKENEERFVKWRDKIIYYVVDDYPKDKYLIDMAQKSSNTGIGEHYWIREFYQKEAIKRALVGLNDQDICYISDVDEIWRPNLPVDFTKDKIFRPQQTSYLYYLNNRTSAVDMWTGTIIMQYKNIKNKCLNHLRTRNKTYYTVIKNGGWHFEALGGFEGAKKKMELGLHPDYYQEENVKKLEERVNKNIDYKGRNITAWTDETNLPEYLIKNKERYKRFFK